MKFAALITQPDGTARIKVYTSRNLMCAVDARDIIAARMQNGDTITMVQAVESYAEPLEVSETQIERAQHFISGAAEILELNLDKLLGAYRGRRYTDARAMIAHILREKTPLGFTQIGGLMNRDHSTVIYMVRRAEDHLLTDFDFRMNYNKVEHIF